MSRFPWAESNKPKRAIPFKVKLYIFAAVFFTSIILAMYNLTTASLAWLLWVIFDEFLGSNMNKKGK